MLGLETGLTLEPIMSKNAEPARQPESVVGNRQLLLVTEHHVSDATLKEVTSTPRFEREDIVEPAKVECLRPNVSFTLRFHARRTTANSMIVLEVCKLRSTTPDLLVVCVCSGQARAAVREDLRRRLDCPTTPLVEAFTGDGCRCTYRVVWTHQMSVRAEVYIAEKPPASGPQTLGLDLEAARAQGLLCDVVFKVDGEELAAHRAVVAARSPVFLRMLQSGFQEDLEGVVHVEGVSAPLFRKFLTYLYRGELEREEHWKDCEVDLLELADRYMVDAMKAECERRLMQVGMGAVVSLLQTVSTRPCISSSVRSRAVEVAIENWSQISTTHEWADFDAQNPILADFIRGGCQARRRSL
ncbi:uncharacterized protein LOC117646917 isoform X2 [Thrips palmi]|uniref:Uncharacterized protein LOC117646917 isoform X2 n=1 Tax=Thrips palmi TaxID=161013 RepID=A0A6P8ZPI4_THRPL|nr:uncharacterized protein LOC117646917 isoform X2 [Thrips palmi]